MSGYENNRVQWKRRVYKMTMRGKGKIWQRRKPLGNVLFVGLSEKQRKSLFKLYLIGWYR